MRLLIAHDGREGGRDALELARVLTAETPDAGALVMTVLRDGPVPLTFRALSDDEAAAAKPIFDEAREALPGIELETRAYGAGSPAGILTMIAERESFDAIVVGSPHRGALGRIVLGSVGHSLLNGAPVDVAIAPTGYAGAGLSRLGTIAVGYDGSSESRHALERAASLARPARAKLKLVTVVSIQVPLPMTAMGSFPLEYPENPDRVISEGLESLDASIDAESERRHGDPAAELIRACENGVDLLVLGSRGYGPLARVLLGSVSHRVTHDATIPVIVTRRPG